MKKQYYQLILLSIACLLCSHICFSQDTLSIAGKEKDRRPIDKPFNAGVLLDNQTVVVLRANTLEFMIQHRFGTFSSNSFDFAGLYAPSNIRIGLRYSLTDYLQIGIGSTKFNKLQDINWKWSILKQTRSGSIPLGLTYYGNVEINVREEENFGQEYSFSNRISYFHELIAARKVTRRMSVQTSLKFAHFNQLDTIAVPDLKHNNFAVSLNGKYTMTPQLALIFAYDVPLTTPEQIKSNASLGIEISTRQHSFQIFVGSYNRISPQSNMVFNTNDFTNMDLLLGFNINRFWNF